jgi:peptidoglycan/xylan/chitin deacetylase (PgdA/CDA1 family)
VWKRWQRHAVTVLAYHGVTSQLLPTFHWCQIEAGRFARQMHVLLGAGYRVLPLGEVIDRIERGCPLPDHTACLTFDDGLRNLRTTAFPILEAHGMPATAFLVSDLVDTDQPTWPDQIYHRIMATDCPTVAFEGKEFHLDSPARRAAAHRTIVSTLKAVADETRLRHIDELTSLLGEHPVAAGSPLATLSWSEVEQLRATGLVDFGAHTATHPILSRCRIEKQADELRRSRDALRERLGRAELLAYPNGSRTDFTPDTWRLARELGFRAALTMVHGLHRVTADRFTMRRVLVGADTDIASFECGLLGF